MVGCGGGGGYPMVYIYQFLFFLCLASKVIYGNSGIRLGFQRFFLKVKIST